MLCVRPWWQDERCRTPLGDSDYLHNEVMGGERVASHSPCGGILQASIHTCTVTNLRLLLVAAAPPCRLRCRRHGSLAVNTVVFLLSSFSFSPSNIHSAFPLRLPSRADTARMATFLRQAACIAHIPQDPPLLFPSPTLRLSCFEYRISL